MYADNTLTPKEATRLCALGMLSAEAMPYADLANGVRHFISHVMGPSLDVLGTSIELLKYEGLVHPVAGDSNGDRLEITAKGRAELIELLGANIRASENDLNKLIVALKFRFLDLLDGPGRAHQIEMLAHAVDSEMARLEALRDHHGTDGGHLIEWLDREIESLARRRDWLEAKLSRI
ncbi:MAG: hypothetical protein O2944_05030 [Proteobacteria bacterium]|nr:hypothetical protein [Pseudomonadota bacterium]